MHVFQGEDVESLKICREEEEKDGGVTGKHLFNIFVYECLFVGTFRGRLTGWRTN